MSRLPGGYAAVSSVHQFLIYSTFVLVRHWFSLYELCSVPLFSDSNGEFALMSACVVLLLLVMLFITARQHSLLC